MPMFRATKNGSVQLTAEEEAELLADQAAATAENDRIAEIDATVKTDTIINQLKAMTNAEFDAWWAANVTTAAEAINVLKRVVRVLIRRVL